MARRRLTRKKVNDPIVDTALRDIYDKIEHLMPETAGKASKTAPQIGDFQLVNNGDQTSLAQYTEEGWMVDMNSNYASVSNSKDFRPSVGSSGKSRTPVKGEAVRYDRNKNIAITNDKQERILLNNIGNELRIRNANNTADAKINAKSIKVSSEGGSDPGEIGYKSADGSLRVNTTNLYIPASTVNATSDAKITMISGATKDAVISLGDAANPNWVFGYDNSDSGKFKIHATTDSTLPDDGHFELDTNGNLVTAGTITDGNGNVLGANVLNTGTSAPTAASDFSAGNGSMLWDTTSASLYGLKNDGSQIVRWSGSTFLNLEFNISGFLDNLTSPQLIKAEGTSLGNVHFDCTFNNPTGNTFTGSITHTGTTYSGQSGFPISFDQSDCTGSPLRLIDFNPVDLKHPDNTDSWSVGRKTQTFFITVNDGNSTKSATHTLYFQNKWFYGYSTQATALSNIPHTISGGSSAFVTTTRPTLTTTSITTSAYDNYIWVCYPSRLTGSTPTFKINGFVTTFNENTTASTANSASNPYLEEFKLWRSENTYNNATLTLEIT